MHFKNVNWSRGNCRRMHKEWFHYIKLKNGELNSLEFRITKCGKAVKNSMRMVNIILRVIAFKGLGE